MQVAKWPADRVERRPIDALVPYAKNARTHSELQVGQLAASMREWGWTNPVLVDEAGGIIAGHGRVLAARKLGWSEVPVMVAEGWSEAQKRAYVIADNQLALAADWNFEALSGEVQGLAEWGFDVGLLGFDDLAPFLARQSAVGLTDADAAPALPSNPVATSGQLWALGSHRLLCGDATKAEDTQRVLAGAVPHLMVTDPPYGVEYEPDWRNDKARTSKSMGNRIGAGAVGKINNDDRFDWRDAWKAFPGDVAYIWHAMLHSASCVESLEAAGFSIRAEIVWDKTRLVIGRGDYHAQHESAWYAVRKGKKGHWSGDRTQTTVWAILHQKSETGHSAQKPVECMKRPIENNSSPGQAVYDPFVGSGTTIIAAEMTGRVCHAIEVDPAYIDVCIRRWQDFTGKQATLADGRTFDELSAAKAAS